MAREGEGYANSTEFLMRESKVLSQHVDYARNGEGVATLVFRGQPDLVRELIDRFAELSEDGQRERQGKHPPQTVDLVASLQPRRESS